MSPGEISWCLGVD
jgi:hypothetical protein